MENKTKRIYPSTQLVVALDSKILKVYMWILSWASSTGSVKFYPKQFAKACKMEEDEVERCIQSLIDCKLVDASRIDQTWMLTPNEEQNQKYYKLPISKVLEGKGIEIAEIATWNEEAEVIPTSSKMSKEEIRRTILMLQAQLKESEQVEKMVETVEDDLPFLSMIYKRYEYYSRTGRTWSKWFAYDGEQFEWQLKSSKLKNEYKNE